MGIATRNEVRIGSQHVALTEIQALNTASVMVGSGFSGGNGRVIAILAIAVAFLLRSVTPAGYMFAVAENGEVTVNICGGASHKVLQFDPETGEFSELPTNAKAPEDGGATPSSCPFALSASFIASPIAAPALAPAGLERLPASPPPAEDAHLFAVRAPLPARGPPTLI